MTNNSVASTWARSTRADGRRSQGLQRPWTVKLTQRLMPDDELIEFVCQENEQSSKHFK